MERWRKWRIWTTLCTLFDVVRAADDPGEEFSNNLFSDLAPLLTLFGEQVAKQFLSQSLTVADCIIFAMAPLGIITAMVGAIRTGGPPWLRSIIGRARESHVLAEVEYMTSVSHEVCEIWNGRSAVRVAGSSDTQMFIYVKELDESSNEGKFIWKESPPNQNVEKGDIWPFELFKQHIALGNNVASNIIINLARTRMDVLYGGAVVGVILQTAVLVLGGLITYKLGWLKGDEAVTWYAYPFTAAGTILLVSGMFICASVIEQCTNEFRFASKDPNQALRIAWIQKGITISEQSFDSYALFQPQTLDNVLMSYPAHLLVTVIGTLLSFSGFVLQFVGLRAMHWSASLFQLGATVLMILVRVLIRWNLTTEPASVRLMKGHELDWYA
ncbi:hypothetical protein BJ508DRAFT_207380, partial [Ascobolus immersus RN42]